MPENFTHSLLGGQPEITYANRLINLVPTLYIGLGGTGRNVLMRYRKALFDQYKSVRPECCRFLLIDGDAQKLNKVDGESDEAMAPARLEAGLGEFIGCSISQELYESTLDRIEMRHDRRFKSWLHPHFRSLVPSQMVMDGAGTNRQAGRFQFFMKNKTIREQVKTHLAEMFHFASSSKPVVFGTPAKVYSDRLEVVIITGLAGGTGSGMFLDMAYMIQDIIGNAKSNTPGDDRIEALKNVTPRVTLIAFLPAVFARKDPTLAHRFQQNAYAALLEMEQYSTFRPEDFAGDGNVAGDNSPSEVEFRVNWTDPTGDDRCIRKKPWDTCYLIDDINDRQPGRLRDAEELYQMVADYLFLDFGDSPFAIEKRSIRSNHVQHGTRIVNSPVEVESQVDGKPGLAVVFSNLYGSRFSSFGLAEIQIDREKINRAASYRLGVSLIADRWINRGHFSLDQFKDWTKKDLDEGAAPADDRGTVRFSPDHLWREFFKSETEGQDWIDRIEKTLDGLVGSDDPLLLAQKLEEFDRQLSGSEAPLRLTMERRFEELAGLGETLGKLRQRLKRLARARFQSAGTAATLELLNKYDSFLNACVTVTRKWRPELEGLEKNGEILDRLRESQSVPFVSRWIAVGVEFERALAKAQRVLPERCRRETIPYVENLYAELRAYVAAPQRAGNAMHTPLRAEYFEIQQFLESILQMVKDKYTYFSKHSGSDRKISLLPKWEDVDYDREIALALNRNKKDVGPGKDRSGPDWERAEQAVLAQLLSNSRGQTLADLVDEWMAECRRNSEHKAVIVDAVARACRTLLGDDGINLEHLAHGNVVDYLASRSPDDREGFAKTLIDAAAPYVPATDVSRIHNFRMFCRNVLGRSNGVGPAALDMLQKVEKEIDNAAIEGSNNHEMDRIHERKHVEPTRIALVRELTGFPLSLYSRLPELENAYRDPALSDARKTCHIRYGEVYEDLPDIMLVEDEQYRAIRQYVDYVFRGLCLGFIKPGNDHVFCVRMMVGAFGEQIRPLGMRLNRIVKHACNKPDVREYLQSRWESWMKVATEKHFAALYNALQQSRDLITKCLKLERNIEDPRVPAFNCILRLLTATELDLKKSAEGTKWFELLRDRDDRKDSREEVDRWKTEFPNLCEQITKTCLVPPSENLVPIFQVDETRVKSLSLPGAAT